MADQMKVRSPRKPLAVRAVQRDDVPGLKAIIDATGLFPSEMLDGMLTGYLDGSEAEAIWLASKDGEQSCGIAYCAPEQMTSGTWNLYLIAFHPERQEQGHGTDLLAHLEGQLAARGERVLLVETSGLPEFARTREFYARRGFNEEARIRDFYQAGEDKIVFRKDLSHRLN